MVEHEKCSIWIFSRLLSICLNCRLASLGDQAGSGALDWAPTWPFPDTFRRRISLVNDYKRFYIFVRPRYAKGYFALKVRVC